MVLVECPFERVVFDVLAMLVEIIVAANDVFVKAALPHGISDCAIAFVNTAGREGFKPADDFG